MIPVITKSLGKYVFAPSILISWILIYGLTSGVNHIVAFSSLLGILVFFGGILPSVMVEADEEKSRGYEFLATLPVDVGTVVRAKGLVLAISVAAILLVEAAFIFMHVRSAGYGGDVLMPALSRVVFGASVSLVLGGAALVAIYRFGTYVVLAGFGALGLIINLVAFLIFSRSGGGVGLELEGGFLSKTGWHHLMLMIVAAGFAYHLLLGAAVRVKKGRRI